MTFVSIPTPPWLPDDSQTPDLQSADRPAVLSSPADSAAAPAPPVYRPDERVLGGSVSPGTPAGAEAPAPPAEPIIVPLPELMPELRPPADARNDLPAGATSTSSSPPTSTSVPADGRTRSAVQRSRPAGAAGLTAPGVVVIIFAGSLVGLLLSVFTGGGIGWLFGGMFIASSAYAAFQVRRSDRVAAVIAPPLVFAVLVMADRFVGTTGDALGKSVGALNALLDYGPMLWIGSGVAVVIVLVRAWQDRRVGAT